LSRTVFGLLRSLDAVDAVLDRFLQAGVPTSDVSLLFLATGSGEPAFVSGILADLRLPGMSPLRASGPVRHALESPSPGASLRAGLNRVGIGDPHALRFEEAIRDGAVLVGARAVDEGRVARMREAIDEHEGADSISVRTRRAPSATPTGLRRVG
jgi:hypothetical protein